MNEDKLTIYLMRHGETEWNVEEKFQGQLNSPLTLNGRKKIEITAQKLENIEFNAIYVSQMGRTIDTARIVVENNKYLSRLTNVQMQQMRELNEIHFGVWQGMTYKEILEQFPEAGYNYFNHPNKYEAWITGGEDLNEGLERFLSGLNKIVQFEKKGNILVVTHGTVLELFFNYLENKKIDDLDERKLIKNGDFKVYEVHNGNFIEIERLDK